MENKIIETVGTEVAKGAAKAAAKTLTTGQLVLGGIGCFLGGVVTTLGGIFVGKKMRNRKPKLAAKTESEPEPKEAETKAE